ncbi:MAG: zinc dependent phospholipase C family protein [Defluviitaleaceae bacterium]|nr:zinc dependent phospholipase C family protein [Defluviitaleaceae bacterium]
MPGLITHLLGGQDVLGRVGDDVASVVKRRRRLFNAGCQGPDVFFYYPLGLCLGIGTRMHTSRVGDFFGALAAELPYLDDKTKNAAFAYFAGFLTHYALDCAAHPYVYYKTGFPAPGRRGGRYMAYHLTFEAAIDTQLLRHLQKCRPDDVKWWQSLAQRKQNAHGTTVYLAKNINKVYDTNLKGRNVMAAMACMAAASRILRSPTGLWKRVLGFAENIVLGHHFYAALIHRQEINDGIDYLNEQKAMWREPWDAASRRFESFMELFDKGVADAVGLINALWEYMHGQKTLDDFLELVGDNSFASGQPIKNNVVFKVHDIVFRR